MAYPLSHSDVLSHNVKKLASEAIDLSFPLSDTRKRRNINSEVAGSRWQLVQRIKTWVKWKSVEWLEHVKDVREDLMQFIAPGVVETWKNTEEGFQLTGKR